MTWATATTAHSCVTSRSRPKPHSNEALPREHQLHSGLINMSIKSTPWWSLAPQILGQCRRILASLAIGGFAAAHLASAAANTNGVSLAADLYFDSNEPTIDFGARDLKRILTSKGYVVSMKSLA